MNWRAVACCPEHGAEYFQKIIKSRTPSDFKTEYEQVFVAETDVDPAYICGIDADEQNEPENE